MRKIDLEIVEVVDPDNNVLFCVTKERAHKEGLLHRTILAQLINSEGKWILVKQASDRQDAGQYVVPVGGHVMAGESEAGALQREALEEIGLRDFTYKFIGRGIFDRHILGRHENHYFILYEIYSDKKLELGPETESYKSFTKEQIKKVFKNDPKLFGNAFHFAIKKFYSELFL